ncbi:MAG TPA: BamA/TamA family outer membrane protein [Anaeromyxobacter sp.]
MVRTFCAAAAVLLGAASPILATAADAPSGTEGPGPSEEAPESAPDHASGRTWFALPALFWLPETKLGAAAVGGIHFHLHGAEEASSAFLIAGVAIEGQATADLSSDVWLASGTLLSGRLRVANYPEAFYGIGPDTRVSQREDLTRRFVEATFGGELQVPGLDGRLRAGPRAQGRVEQVRDATPGGLVATHAVAGASGFSALGLGGSVTWDSRDEKLWPTRGAFAQAAYLYYPAAIGRNDGFGRATVEGREFLPLGRGRVLGLAALLEQSHGETPFSILAKIGSTRYLRGIREGRYRDNVAWAAQTELRLPLDHRFAATLFAAVGDVARSLAALEVRTLKVAGGAGLRYRLTGEGATLRADVAMAQAGPEVYVLLLEAF